MEEEPSCQPERGGGAAKGLGSPLPRGRPARHQWTGGRSRVEGTVFGLADVSVAVMVMYRAAGQDVMRKEDDLLMPSSAVSPWFNNA